MSFPELALTSVVPADADADAILLILPALDTPDAPNLDAWPGLADSLRAVGFTGAKGVLHRVFAPEATTKPLAVVGLGKHADPRHLREAAGAGIRTFTGFDTVVVAFPGYEGPLDPIAEGATLGGYRFDAYKAVTGPLRAGRVVLYSAQDEGAGAVVLRSASAIGSAAALVKDLVATPAEWLGPNDLAERAAAEVADLNVDVTIFDEQELEAQGFGGIIGVGKGSDRPPRLVRLDYSPVDATRHVSLVGKGITFDTGGLSLKPAGSMVGMKYDMCGAATVLAVLRAAATLELPVRVTAWLCIADNMPSGRATRPGDVLRMLDGTTVEVLNTDAEGRLVLADGLVAASRENPDLLIDVATLTGAITVALGTRHTGVMGEDSAVAEYLGAAAAVGELAWHMPLPDHMEDDLDSPIADLQNVKMGDPAGGSLFAGLFLRRFVGRREESESVEADTEVANTAIEHSGVRDEADRIPWLHLDIAGTGMNKGAGYGFTDKGTTAATVRSLISLLAGGAL